MRFNVPGDFYNFFSKNKYLEIENFFLQEELEEISHHIDKELVKRAAYKGCRDLWRDSSFIEKFVCNHKMAHLAAQVFNQKFLQLGFDQLFQKSKDAPFLVEPNASIQDFSCIKPLLGAAIVQLKGENLQSPFLPQKKENIVFLDVTTPLPWDIILKPSLSFLLIAYAPLHALYVFEKKDRYTQNLKKLGYGFGDHLSDAHHPILLYK